jgi:hypothetical protein
MLRLRGTTVPLGILALLGSLVLLTGCSSLGAGPAHAAAAAVRFHRVVAAGDDATACDLLAPRTSEEVAKSVGQSCPKALAGAGLPRSTTARTTDVYGGNARVVLDGDTVFLSRFGAQWRVTAAGCTPRQDLPYDCDVKSG